MTQHDMVPREVEQLARVLVQVLFLKQAGNAAEAQQVAREGLEGALGVDVESLSRLEVHALTASGGLLAGEKAIAVADLLQESESAAARERALWLYEMASTSGSAVPLDIHQRIAALRAALL